MEYYLIVYKNTYDAMESEKVLKGLGFEFRIMPTPTSITQSCGICTRFELEDDINKIVAENLIHYKNIYHRNSEGYKMIK